MLHNLVHIVNLDLHGEIPHAVRMTTRCPFCAWPDSEPLAVLSRHATPEGQTVWTRCVCGSVQVRLSTATGSYVVSRSRPAVTAQSPLDTV